MQITSFIQYTMHTVLLLVRDAIGISRISSSHTSTILPRQVLISTSKLFCRYNEKISRKTLNYYELARFYTMISGLEFQLNKPSHTTNRLIRRTIEINRSYSAVCNYEVADYQNSPQDPIYVNIDQLAKKYGH